jgi:anti-sigma factor (TIGR02949 family)
MGDCGCDKAQKDLEEFLHNELCSEEAADIRAHMENCAECADELHVGVVLTEALKRACNESAPDLLKNELVERFRNL